MEDILFKNIHGIIFSGLIAQRKVEEKEDIVVCNQYIHELRIINPSGEELTISLTKADLEKLMSFYKTVEIEANEFYS